jgi:CRISPR/Cas system CSM-associated protein Csm3 (group 7 of RAMP superfamily)
LTRETELADTQALVQSRVRIDRFTGGSYPTALFTQQPAFGGEEAMVKLEITLRRPEDAEIGLLLLVLKDLWTGDLPLGGESSVGRGRLHGQRATLALHEHGKPANWRIEQAGDMLQFDPADSPAKLEAFVEKLQQYRMPEDERRRAA